MTNERDWHILHYDCVCFIGEQGTFCLNVKKLRMKK
jgi:hypothetical protein